MRSFLRWHQITPPDASVYRCCHTDRGSDSVQLGIPCITTRPGISAVVSALAAMHRGDWEVRPLQEYHQRCKALAKV